MSVADLLVRAPRIGLDGLGDADLQQRVDVKYLVPLSALAALAGPLAASHALLSVDGLTSFGYRSSYVDTPDLACFHAHRQGRRLRWKARTRLYADSGRCRFEVKLKTGRGDTDKHSVLVDAAEHGTLPAAGAALLEQVLAEHYRLPAPELLLPSLLVEHQRSTLVAADGSGRTTVDSDLRFVVPSGAGARLADDLVLVETKSAGGRSRADLLLRAAGLRPVSVSKYSCGLALTDPSLPDQPWRRLLQQHFHPTPTTLQTTAAAA